MLHRGRVRLERCDGIRNSVLLNGGLHHSRLKGKYLGTPYVIAVHRYFPEVQKKQLARVNRQNYMARGCGTARDGRMARNSMERGARC